MRVMNHENQFWLLLIHIGPSWQSKSLLIWNELLKLIEIKNPPLSVEEQVSEKFKKVYNLKDL